MSRQAGVPLDDWQLLVLEDAMGERADGSWAAKRVGLSVPRQNGKSQLMVVRALAGALIFGEKKIVISAHQADTARESFSKLLEILDADGNEWLRKRLDPKYGRNGVMNAINREAVKFSNGALIQFKARTLAGGRGFSSDCLLLDEAQRLGRAAWASINSTMSARENPQVWLLGTPPTPEDDGQVFESVRAAAIDGLSTSSAWLEWSSEPEDDPADEFTRWKANPAWNSRINHEVVNGEFETYTREQFALDRLGIWRSEMKMKRLISAEDWAATAVSEAPDGLRSIAVAFNMDGSRMAVAGAIRHDDGVHVEVVGEHSGELEAGIGSLADWLAERWRNFTKIVICGQAGAAALEQALRERRVSPRVIHVASGPEYFQACAVTLDSIRDSVQAVSEGRRPVFTHPVAAAGDVLDESVANCTKKVRSKVTGSWGWTATSPEGDETPIEAVSLAFWAAKSEKRVRTGKAVFG